MSRRGRVAAILIVAAIHLAAFVPTLGDYSSILDRGFFPRSERILDGDEPYADGDFEYPPLALPLVVGPAWVTDGLEDYREAFGIEMLVFDLGIVALLGLAVPGPRRRVLEALGIYTAGVIAVSGVVLPDSRIEDMPLALARFDLAVALLIAAAVLAREARRTALWGWLLGAATAIKAFPAVLVPNLLRLEGHRGWALVSFMVPLTVAAAAVLIAGDDFWAAVTYHSDRDLQIETVGAMPILVSHLLFGTDASVSTGAGGFNLAAPSEELARTLSFAALVSGTLLVIYAGWRRRTPNLLLATALLAVVVVPAPVLSPQFLLWILPLSAIAYGLGRENVVLLACFVLTEVMLHNYDGVEELSGDFVWTLTARNLLLLVYLALVLIPVFRPYPGKGKSTEGEPLT